MGKEKQVSKPRKPSGCESCSYKSGDFFDDAEDEEIVRCYCTARKVNVNADLMSKDCDFYQTDPEYRISTKDNRTQGI